MEGSDYQDSHFNHGSPVGRTSAQSAPHGTEEVMITFHSDGENRYRLERSDGRDIGWIRGRVIGFGGIRTEGQAIGAVRCGVPVFDASLRRHYFGWPTRATDGAEFRLVHDGAYEWVSMGVQPLARLYRPEARRSHGDFAIEFVLPSYASEGVAISVAQTLGAAIQAYLATTNRARSSTRATARDLARTNA
jgi:hypothetical protein